MLNTALYLLSLIILDKLKDCAHLSTHYAFNFDTASPSHNVEFESNIDFK